MLWRPSKSTPPASALIAARRSLREHVELSGEQIVLIRQLDTSSLSTYHALFRLFDEMTSGCAQYGVVVSLEGMQGRPTPAVRELLLERFAGEGKRIAHVGLVVSPLSVKQPFVKFLFSFLSFTRFSFHSSVEGACTRCSDKLYG